MNENEKMDLSALNSLDNLLSQVDINKVSEDGNSNYELQDGYYLGEVSNAILTTSKSSGNKMIQLTFNLVESKIVDEDGDLINNDCPKFKVYLYWSLKDIKSIEKMIEDMLKFKNDKNESVMEKEYFTNEEVLSSSIEMVIGYRCWIKISTSEKVGQNGEKNQFKNLISWKRADSLGL